MAAAIPPMSAIGGPDEPPHWQREQLNQVLWKFLADHVGHRIDVRLEHEMSDEILGYQEIGGDSDTDISIETYLDDWPGRVDGSKGASRDLAP